MMTISWLLATMLVAAPKPELRIPLTCSTSSTAGGLASGTHDVTAVRCDSRAGFFVPSVRYRELSAAWDEVDSRRRETSLLDTEVRDLRLALRERTFSATTSKNRADLLTAELETETARADAAEHRAFVREVLFFAAGVVTVGLGAWALGQIHPTVVSP